MRKISKKCVFLPLKVLLTGKSEKNGKIIMTSFCILYRNRKSDNTVIKKVLRKRTVMLFNGHIKFKNCKSEEKFGYTRRQRMMKITKKQMAWLLTATMVLSVVPGQTTQAAKAVKLISKKVTLTVGKSKTIQLKNNKKKTTWKILSGKKYIKLSNKKKNSVKIVAVKAGKAKVQVKAGKKKYTCNVTVKAAKSWNIIPSVTISPRTTKQPGTTTKPLATKTPGATTKPTATTAPTNTSAKKDASDVAVLQSIIQEQKQKGAAVSDNPDAEEYTWNEGRLTGIKWTSCKLKGSLDVSKLTALETLYCEDNQLDTLDLSGNVALKTLFCNYNQLANLDVSHNPALAYLYCYSNQLSSLDLSQNPALESVFCFSNQLKDLDVSHNPILAYLHCYSNQLSSLDVSQNPLLESLDCRQNPSLTSLDVSNNTILKELRYDDAVSVIGKENTKLPS